MTSDPVELRLSDYLSRRGPDVPGRVVGPLVALTGGWAGSLYTFRLQGPGGAAARSLVLKLYAPDARGGEHARREWRALTRLHEVGFPVPQAVLVEPDAGPLGRPFLVMNHVPGESLWSVLEAADTVTRARTTRSFVAQLVALHDLDPRVLDPRVLDPAVRADPYRELDRELEQLRADSAACLHGALVETVRWLDQRSRAVPCERPVILHRDYHPWNVLVDPVEHLWVLDWDWGVGDARFDVAWTCTLLQRSGLHAFSTAVRDEYAQQSGSRLDRLGYFEVLATVRWLLNVSPALDAGAERREFRAFLVDPVRRAQAFLREQTGRDLDLAV